DMSPVLSSRVGPSKEETYHGPGFFFAEFPSLAGTGRPGHCSRYLMSGDTHSAHSLCVMLRVRRPHNRSAQVFGPGHRRTVWSQLPETIRASSRLNATPVTPLSCPPSGPPMGWPDTASQSRSVLSSLPDTMLVPSALKATADTRSV